MEWTRGRWAPLLFEHIAIAGGYVLLAWLGMFLMPDGRLMTVWPAGGFALAVLLQRGTSRWPAILLGSLIGSYLFTPWRWVTGEVTAEFSVQAYTAVLMSVTRTFSTVVGVWLIRRFVGTTRWPHTVNGVLGFMIVAGLVHPALIAIITQVALLAGGLVGFGSEFLRQTWVWFNANVVGNLLVAPFLLALVEGPVGRPRRSHRELALLAVLSLAGSLFTLETERRFGELGIPLGYPMLPLLIWVPLRFGSQGAALFNVLMAALMIGSIRVLGFGESELARTFVELQARLVVIFAVFLVLAAAFEERHQLQESLEKERRNLEERVTERTLELARSLSLLHSSLESTADGLLVIDRKGRIIAMNQRFARLWEIPSAVLEGGDDARVLACVREQLVDPTAFLSRVEYLYAHPEV
ncbi:MAG: MASE1 domain-containing protein, partial [Archangium sp.]